MSNSAVENQQRAMSRIISNIASIQSLFPVMWDPIDNVPQATWADRLGLVDRPESAWDRIQQPAVALRLQELQGADNLAKMANGQIYIMGHNDVNDPEVETRRLASGVATIQSLFPDLWDHVDDSPEDVWRNRLEDARRPDSPWNRGHQPYVPFAAQQRDFLGPIGRPLAYEEENEDDWSDSESEFEDDWASDYDDDSGFGSGSDAESVASMDHQQDPDDGLDVADDPPIYVDREYYCPSCDRIYIFRHFMDQPYEAD